MMCASNPEERPRRRRLRPADAFTLTELLVVISIVAILLSLLYGAIRTVNRYSRETITRGELANIEAAWKHYFDYYHAWPTNNVESCDDATTAAGQKRYAIEEGDVQFEIGPRLAAMLSGQSTNAPGLTPLNPDAVPFLDVTRFDREAAPISAWGDRGGERYFVRLDANGDNTLKVPLDSSGSTTTNIYRQVAIWTSNPELPPKIIANWQQ